MRDSLSNIENKINLKIKELKDKMKKTNQRTETDRLWVRMEALQWVLAQILEMVKIPCFHKIITAYLVGLELDPRLCIIMLDLSAQDDVLVVAC
jgi:hypothetical protein